MPPNLSDRLIHIQTAIDDIRSVCRDRSRDDFANDRLLRITVERLFEIISEASRFIPEDKKKRETSINWRRIADLGNWLRHAYHRIDADILWNIIEDDLDPLEDFIHRISSERS